MSWNQQTLSPNMIGLGRSRGFFLQLFLSTLYGGLIIHEAQNLACFSRANILKKETKQYIFGRF